eukprot:17282-Chlamydomonas_euryale.AAC.1
MRAARRQPPHPEHVPEAREAHGRLVEGLRPRARHHRGRPVRASEEQPRIGGGRRQGEPPLPSRRKRCHHNRDISLDQGCGLGVAACLPSIAEAPPLPRRNAQQRVRQKAAGLEDVEKLLQQN